MKKNTLTMAIIFALSVFLTSTVYATPLPNDLILDTYLHPNDTETSQQDDDRIGTNPPYEIYGYRWNSSTLEIYTTWSAGLDGGSSGGAYLGDVFFFVGNPSLSSSVFAALALRDHTSNITGESDDGIQQGDLFKPGSFRLSNAYFPTNSTGDYGDNEFVTATAAQILGNVDVEIGNYDGDVNVIKAYFDSQTPGHQNIIGSLVRTQFTCANDVGAPVPEPATILLIGVGLLGLVGYGRKRRKS